MLSDFSIHARGASRGLRKGACRRPLSSAYGGLIFKTFFLLALTAAVFGGGAYFTYKLYVLPQQKLAQESVVAAASPPPDTTLPEYSRIHQLLDAHQWLDARTAYEHFLQTYPASTKTSDAKDDLGQINVAIYFSGASPDKDAYVIRPGDKLALIEKKVKVSGDVIMRTNGITDPRRLRVGDTLYIPHPDFALIIDRTAQMVTLYDHARYFKQYHPTKWSVAVPKTTTPPISGKVADVAAFRNGVRVSYGSKDYDDSVHTIQISPGTYSLYTDPAEGGAKTSAGIDLSASDMGELSALLTRGVPVTIR